MQNEQRYVMIGTEFPEVEIAGYNEDKIKVRHATLLNVARDVYILNVAYEWHGEIEIVSFTVPKREKFVVVAPEGDLMYVQL